MLAVAAVTSFRAISWPVSVLVERTMHAAGNGSGGPPQWGRRPSPRRRRRHEPRFADHPAAGAQSPEKPGRTSGQGFYGTCPSGASSARRRERQLPRQPKAAHCRVPTRTNLHLSARRREDLFCADVSSFDLATPERDPFRVIHTTAAAGPQAKGRFPPIQIRLSANNWKMCSCSVEACVADFFWQCVSAISGKVECAGYWCHLLLHRIDDGKKLKIPICNKELKPLRVHLHRSSFFLGVGNQSTRSGFDSPLGSGQPVLRPGIYPVA